MQHFEVRKLSIWRLKWLAGNPLRAFQSQSTGRRDNSCVSLERIKSLKEAKPSIAFLSCEQKDYYRVI